MRTDDEDEGSQSRAENRGDVKGESFLVLFVFSSVAAVCNFKMINTTGMKSLKPS